MADTRPSRNDIPAQRRYNRRLGTRCMTKWAADATEFRVSITHNVRRGTSYSYIPKPVLAKLGNPEGLRFVIRGNEILVTRPD